MSKASEASAEAANADASAVAALLAGGAAPRRASPLTAVLAFGWRGMLKIKHVPEQLIDATLTPVLLTVMFTFMFGGAISGSTRDYLQFLLPGILVMAVLFTTVYSGVALSTDVSKGAVDRFRSLPIWKPAPLIGAVLGDTVRFLIAGSVVMVVGLILGFRPEGLWGMPAALLLVVLFAFGLAWVFTTLGLIMRSPAAVTNAGFMTLFPLTFLSNVFVDPTTLPGWLEPIVEANPVSHLATASRALMEQDPAIGDIVYVLVPSALLTVVFAPITSWLYRRRA